MQFLLILSAILSTLTGVVTGTRAPVMHSQNCAMAGSRVQVIAVSTAAISGHRHLLGGVGWATPFIYADATTFMPVSVPRLYMDRPRT